MGGYTGDGATYSQNFLGPHPQSPTHYVSSLAVVWDGHVHTAQSRVWVTQSDAQRVTRRHLCEKLVLSTGIRNHQETQPPTSCLDLVSEGFRDEAATIGVAPVAAAEISRAHGPLFLDDMTLHELGSFFFYYNNGTS